MTGIIQYVPDHVQAASTPVSALTNGAYNFFSQFSQQTNNTFVPYFQSMNQQATSLANEELQIQMVTAQNMPQGK